ncbi:MAG TPA: response regulator [Verrucomicrobiae bacterium]|nr:response regulator [Verrucomicrobiae bacterium]
MKHVLLVEDSAAQSRLIEEAFKVEGAGCTLDLADDGGKVLDYLKRKPPFEKKTFPDLILLDLHLPPMGGEALLKMIREENSFEALPVLVLSNSDYVENVSRCYQLGANCYLIKPSSFRDLCGMVRGLRKFWLDSKRAGNPVRV